MSRASWYNGSENRSLLNVSKASSLSRVGGYNERKQTILTRFKKLVSIQRAGTMEMETIATSRKSQISVPARAFHPMLRMMFIADFPIYVIVHSRPMWYPCSTGFLPRMPTSSYLSSSIHFSFLFYSPWIKSLPPFSESTNFSIRALIGASEDLFSAIDTIFEFQHNCPPQASRKSCKCP